jgi:hypothetical protein
MLRVHYNPCADNNFLCSFDLVAAVIYPILVLIYSFRRFHFDHDLFGIFLEVLPPGSFECSARLFADPAERELFIASLNSLRILSYTDLVLRLCMNLSFCHRFLTVVDLMVETASTQRTGTSRRESLAQMFRHQRRVPKPAAALFAAFAVAVVAYTQTSIASSHAACTPHPECVVYAYQWDAGDLCPCRTLVDIYRTPLTFQEWSEPVDVYEKVKTLSQAGMLQNLQLINRALRSWPEELQNCKNLQYMYVRQHVHRRPSAKL